VDTRTSAMFVARSAKRNVVLPSFIGFHWAKRVFEWMYLRRYR
jgi:sulfide:quinone oxidoreductase